MKADRGYCLRCDAPLVAAPAPARAATRRDWLIVAGSAGALALMIAVGLLFRSHPPPSTPPVTAQTSAATSAGHPERAEESPSSFTPATSGDAVRVGTAAFNGGDFEAARVSYEDAIAKNPNDPEAINNLGQALAHLKRTDEAIEQFRRAIQIVPDKWSYRFNLAHALGEQGDWDGAIAEYQRAVAIFGDDYATQYNLAMALHKKGDEAAAVPAFERAIALAPSEPTFHISLGQSLEKLGRLEDARKEYAQYLAMEPDGPDAARVKAHLDGLPQAGSAQQ